MSDTAWARVVGAVKEGKLVVFPTDTVYGIGCDPYNVTAIERVYAAKGRSFQKALPLLLSNLDSLARVAGDVPPSAWALAQAFWPGALTLVVFRNPALPAELGGGDTIAVRLPDHDELRRFIERCGGALAATSANLSGQPDALTAQEAAEYFGDRVDVIIDGGRVRGGVPSTVVSCVTDPPAILREGAIPADHIRDVLKRQRDV